MRPIDALRITGDLEFGYNDNSYTRIDPRQVQSYKIHANYKPRPWANLEGAVEIHENRDNVATVNNLEHDRSYSFATILTANPRLSVDFGYNYWNVFTQSLVCFAYSTSSANPAPPARHAACVYVSSRCADAAVGPGVPDYGRDIAPRCAFNLWQHGSFRPRRSDVETHEAGDSDGRL